MNYNSKMGYSGNEQDYQLLKSSLGKLKLQKELLRYLTNVLPNPTDIVSLDNAQNTVKSVKAQLANKNLIPYPYTDTTKTFNGITFTVNSDGSVTANGTATAQAYFRLQQSFSLKKGQYFLSGCPTDGAGSTYSLYLSNADYTFYKADVGNGISVNSEDDKTVSIAINITKGTTVNNLIFNPQLELGTTATAYTPYFSDFSTVKVNSCGKNFFDKSIPFSNYLTYSGGYKSLSIYVGKGSTTTVSLSQKYNTGLGGYFYCAAYKVSSGMTIPDSQKKWLYYDSIAALCQKSVSMVSEDGYVSLVMTSDAYNNFKDEIMVEIGSTDTEYEPYKGQTYTPTATGEVNGITVLTPTTNIINDKGLLFTKVIGDDFNYIN